MSTDLERIETIIQRSGYLPRIRKFRAGTIYIQAVDIEAKRRHSLGELKGVAKMSEEELCALLSVTFAEPPEGVPPGTYITYQLQRRRCGKPACKMCQGDGPGHGPYWYCFWRAQGKVHSSYIGKEVK